MNRVIEIQNDGYYLSAERGFMVIEKKGEAEARKIPLEDIGVLILSGSGCGLSTNLVVRLLETGTGIVLCGANYHPAALIHPVESHHAQAGRIRQQIDASAPLQKRLWQALVQCKIRHQGEVLALWAGRDEGLTEFAKRVVSGDPDNKEAQAARRYWPALLGSSFRRDPKSGGINALLNYGYAIIRAQIARSVAACGFHPALGIHHQNDANPFCLVDDLIEPFRPLVDIRVREMLQDATEPPSELTPDIKRELAGILGLSLKGAEDSAALPTHILRLCQSLVQSYATKQENLIFPASILPVADSGDEADDS